MATYGPYHGSSAGSGGSGEPWAFPARVNATIGSPTGFSTQNGISQTLSSTGYDAASNFGVGFAIPSADTIVGISLDLARYVLGPSGIYPGECTDDDVRLICSLGSSPDNKADPGFWPRYSGSGSKPRFSYGGPTDLWGYVGLTPAIVNDAAFGFTFIALGDGVPTNSAQLWNALITVWTSSGHFEFPADDNAEETFLARSRRRGFVLPVR